jgi:hypothetical protein
MIRNFTYSSLCICLCFLSSRPAAAQDFFERPIPKGYQGIEVLQSAANDYYVLSGTPYTVTRLNSAGYRLGQLPLDVFPATVYPFTGIGVTSDRVLAVGGESKGGLTLASAKHDLTDSKSATLYTAAFKGAKVAGLSNNGAAILVSTPNDNGYRNPHLFLTDANLTVQSDRVYTLPANIDIVYVGELANHDLVLVGRDAETGAGSIILTQADGTPRVAAPGLPPLLDVKVYGNKLYVLSTTNNGHTATLHVYGDNLNVAQQVDLFTHTAAIPATTYLSRSYNGDIAVATPAENKPGMDLHVFTGGSFTETATVYHSLAQVGGRTVPSAASTANIGFAILTVLPIRESPDLSDLPVLVKTNAAGQGPEHLPLEAVSPTGMEEVDSLTFQHWADLDGDGQRELFLTNDKINVFRYYATTGQFARINTPFPGERQGFQSLSTADVDNDGDLDFYINRHRARETHVLSPIPNILYRNNGDGSFTAETGMICPEGISTRQSFWIDLNNDYWLDLYLSGATHDRAYLNNGDGNHFTELDLTFLPRKNNVEAVPIGMLWEDLNGDGYVDAINQPEQDEAYILLNQQGTGFTKVPLQQYISLAGPPYVVPTRIQNFSTGYVNGKRCLLIGQYDQLRYFEHDGTRYVEKPRPETLEYYRNYSAKFYDFDNDGDQDVISYQNERAWLNRNDGEAGFSIPAFDAFGLSAFTWYDYDNNGSKDLIAGRAIVKNNSTNNWLKIRLQGNISPAAGTGAVVSIHVNGVWQHRTITTDAGPISGEVGDEAFFGLGNATTVDELTIAWPSGCTSQYTNVTANQRLAYAETCAGPAPTVNILGNGCLGAPQRVNLGGGGTQFAWYRAKDQEEAFFISGTESVTFDTLTRSQTLYVANISGDSPSRRMPVALSAGVRPVFHVAMTQTGSRFQFTATSADPTITTYQWYLADNQLAGTGSSYTPPPLATGAQRVCARVVSNGCDAWNCVEFIVTGVEESILTEYTVHPNPVKGTLHITHKSDKPFALELIHITGARAYQTSGHASYEVNTEGYAPGLYILRINGQGAIKIVKQ